MKVYQGPYYQWFRPHRWFKDCAMWFYGVGSGDAEDDGGAGSEDV